MASTTWPDGSPRSVDDAEYEVLGAAWSADGILGVSGDSTPVFGDSTGRQVKFRAGKRAVVHGHGWAAGATDIVVAVAANSSGQPRVDLAVLGLDRTTWLVTEYVKQGTPGASPVAPTPQRDALGAAGKWELPLATIAVANGASTITAADVTSVSPFLGPQQILYVASTTVLATLPGPSVGQLAYVEAETTAGHGLWRYTGATNGWRRADWSNSWGVIGGQKYTGTGDAGYIYETSGDPGLRTGNVTLLAGRRYSVDLRAPINWSATTDVQVYFTFDILKVGGASVGTYAIPPMPIWQSWALNVQVEYAPAANETVNFRMDALGAMVTGTDFISAGLARGTNTFFRVRDMGPADKLATA